MRVGSDLVSKFPRQARWAVPVGAVAAVALVVAGSSLAGAQGVPRLPARTTAQLLASVEAPSAVLPAMQAVVQETANLGLPNLPGSDSSDPLSGLTMLTGSHTIKVWYDGPTRVRIAIPVTLGEADLRRDGNNVWVWDSKTNRATHYVLPAGAGEPAAPPASMSAAPTPQQLAREILAAVGPTTKVGLQSNVTVAGQPAYQLSLAPRDHRSLVGQVRIAIDAHNSLPLSVQVFARGASSPAFELAYTSLSFTRPDPSNFAFTPPPGAKVKTVTVPEVGRGVQVPAPPGVPVRPLKQVRVQVISGKPRSWVTFAPIAMPASVRKQLQARLAKVPDCLGRAQHSQVMLCFANRLARPGSLNPAQALLPAGGPRVMGRDWLSVLVLPAGFAPGGLPGNFAGIGVSSSASASSSSQSEVIASSDGAGIGVSDLGAAVLSAARPVHGAWGSGRLLQTSLISVLMTSNGQVLIGAVQPSVLYADAAHLPAAQTP